MIDGESCMIDEAGAQGDLGCLPRLVDELMARRPDILAVIGGVAALASKRAVSSIPVVHATVLPPEEVGLEAPNLTGITTFDPHHPTRQLRLLKNLIPGLRRLACLTDADAPVGGDGCNPLASGLSRAAESEALCIEVIALGGQTVGVPRAFEAIGHSKAQGLVALEVPAVLAHLPEIAVHAELHRLPTIFPHGRDSAGVAMLGPGLGDAIEPMADYIAALTAGARVRELPVREVRHDRLVIDIGAARRIGLSIPTSVLNHATELIEDRAHAV